MTREEIFEKIKTEREYQDKNWGTSFDDKNTINDWATYIGHYTAKATRMDVASGEQMEDLLKVATLAIAAIEAGSRNGKFAPRHYDKL